MAAPERHGAEAERGEALKGLRVLPPVEKVVGVDGETGVGRIAADYVLAEDRELLGLGVVRQAQQHVAHDGEHDDVCADAEGESKKSGRAEGRASAQLTKCEAQFAEKSVQACLLLRAVALLPRLHRRRQA